MSRSNPGTEVWLPHITYDQPGPLSGRLKCVATVAFPRDGKVLHLNFLDEETARTMMALFEAEARMRYGHGRWETEPRYDIKSITWECNGRDRCLLDA